MPYGKHLFKIVSNMDTETIFEYPSSKYALPHWKFVFHYCAQFQHIYLPTFQNQIIIINMIVQKYICICINKLPAVFCTVRVRRSFNEKKQCQLCEACSDSIVTARLYISKDVFVTETSIFDFSQ